VEEWRDTFLRWLGHRFSAEKWKMHDFTVDNIVPSVIEKLFFFFNRSKNTWRNIGCEVELPFICETATHPVPDACKGIGLFAKKF
jgi:hypothetical protein